VTRAEFELLTTWRELDKHTGVTDRHPHDKSDEDNRLPRDSSTAPHAAGCGLPSDAGLSDVREVLAQRDLDLSTLPRPLADRTMQHLYRVAKSKEGIEDIADANVREELMAVGTALSQLPRSSFDRLVRGLFRESRLNKLARSSRQNQMPAPAAANPTESPCTEHEVQPAELSPGEVSAQTLGV
jgi:hypothetical protein